MVKCVFLMSLKDLQGFIKFFLNLLNCRYHALTIHALASKPKQLTSRSRRK
ncbi:hypothetical protein BTN50_0346 [Candidatus Enterovibrio altilux]|uniref:Uncharacterized protein n=1 Tax=Candidatus Enterovibrio altilux TaxID=1927128 RepID=A0A291B7A3_9GAMM|nr:hypothetical protein BTN50_0346 [Candidatus Enterovibrio luxaltus]